MCHDILDPELSINRGKAPRKLFLFALGGRFLGCALFRLRLALGFTRGGFCALGFAFRSLFGFGLLWLAGWKVRRGKALAIKSDLSDPYRRKGLAMAIDLLVLLLALEMEDQNLVSAA